MPSPGLSEHVEKMTGKSARGQPGEDSVIEYFATPFSAREPEWITDKRGAPASLSKRGGR